MEYISSLKDDYIMREEQYPIIKIFFIWSRGQFSNFDNILECIRMLNSKQSAISDPKNLMKVYYLGCTGLRKEGYGIENGSLCLWALAEQIIHFNKIHNINSGIHHSLEEKNLLEIKKFYLKTIAKTPEDYKKCDP